MLTSMHGPRVEELCTDQVLFLNGVMPTLSKGKDFKRGKYPNRKNRPRSKLPYDLSSRVADSMPSEVLVLSCDRSIGPSSTSASLTHHLVWWEYKFLAGT